MNFKFRIPTRIKFGPGTLEALATEQMPGMKALLVVFAGPTMRKHGYLDRTIALLKANGVECVLFDKILPNPIHKHVMEGAALANTLSGMVESTPSCTSEHSMEHALSAFHPDLPHGAGLIMLSKAYFSFFACNAPERVAKIAPAMGVETRGRSDAEAGDAFVNAMVTLQHACGVGDLKMSDYGITELDAAKLADNAWANMGGLFRLDPSTLSLEDTTRIIADAWR